MLDNCHQRREIGMNIGEQCYLHRVGQIAAGISISRTLVW
jgi:hypothetical protein